MIKRWLNLNIAFSILTLFLNTNASLFASDKNPASKPMPLGDLYESVVNQKNELDSLKPKIKQFVVELQDLFKVEAEKVSADYNINDTATIKLTAKIELPTNKSKTKIANINDATIEGLYQTGLSLAYNEYSHPSKKIIREFKIKTDGKKSSSLAFQYMYEELKNLYLVVLIDDFKQVSKIVLGNGYVPVELRFDFKFDNIPLNVLKKLNHIGFKIIYSETSLTQSSVANYKFDYVIEYKLVPEVK
jgi:hypothetical protein